MVEPENVREPWTMEEPLKKHKGTMEQMKHRRTMKPWKNQ